MTCNEAIVIAAAIVVAAVAMWIWLVWLVPSYA
jgi:hypothetical protein